LNAAVFDNFNQIDRDNFFECHDVSFLAVSCASKLWQGFEMVVCLSQCV
jgi:hypothetical protein